MTIDITFHYPPELFDLLVETIPLLTRAKKGVVLFFRGAGVADDLLADFVERLGLIPTTSTSTKSRARRWSGSTGRARRRCGSAGKC